MGPLVILYFSLVILAAHYFSSFIPARLKENAKDKDQKSDGLMQQQPWMPHRSCVSEDQTHFEIIVHGVTMSRYWLELTTAAATIGKCRDPLPHVNNLFA